MDQQHRKVTISVQRRDKKHISSIATSEFVTQSVSSASNTHHSPLCSLQVGSPSATPEASAKRCPSSRGKTAEPISSALVASRLSPSALQLSSSPTTASVAMVATTLAAPQGCLLGQLPEQVPHPASKAPSDAGQNPPRCYPKALPMIAKAKGAAVGEKAEARVAGKQNAVQVASSLNLRCFLSDDSVNLNSSFSNTLPSTTEAGNPCTRAANFQEEDMTGNLDVDMYAEVNSIYDEEDEEQAVQQYMNVGGATFERERQGEGNAGDVNTVSDASKPTCKRSSSTNFGVYNDTKHLTGGQRRGWRPFSAKPPLVDKASVSPHDSLVAIRQSMVMNAAVCVPANQTLSQLGIPNPSSRSTRTALHSPIPPASAQVMESCEMAQACRALSLYDAFFLDLSDMSWRVQDLVLAKCLEYVRLMGYEHPLLRHDRAFGLSSLWSSSANVPSPITTTTTATTTTSGLRGEARPPGGDIGKALETYNLEHASLTCAADRVGILPLFLKKKEAMRWIMEQEYVIGVILLCCAWDEVKESKQPPASFASSDRIPGGAHTVRACLPSYIHPIHWVAQHVLQVYPQWGDFNTFSALWEVQIRLVLGTAAPSHQRIFLIPIDNLIISTDFEGGNLQYVKRAVEPYSYDIWLDPDPGGSSRIWFRFAVSGAKEGRALRFRLRNAEPHVKLYQYNGMLPVWRDGSSQVSWAPVETCGFHLVRTGDGGGEHGEVSFSIFPRSSVETIQVAFCAPYTYADLLCHICHWRALVKSATYRMSFEEEILCHTPEGRKLHLLVITGPTLEVKPIFPTTASKVGQRVKGGGGRNSTSRPRFHVGGAPTPTHGANRIDSSTICGPYANFNTGKKVVLISGRVHPGEVTASHAVHGLISFLISSDPRALQLRQHFIFFIVPMLNPDGVSRGSSRLDPYGNNLNRCYNNPDPKTQPTVHALRKLFEHLQSVFQERFIMYLDFHSHASQSSGFIFGNYLPPSVQHWNMVFPKIIELQVPRAFSFGLCRFGKVHMVMKDGTSRVLFGTSLIHSYTVELPYFTDCIMYADTFIGINSGNFTINGDIGTGIGVSGAAIAGEAGQLAQVRRNASLSNHHKGPPSTLLESKRSRGQAAGEGKGLAYMGAKNSGNRPRCASAGASERHKRLKATKMRAPPTYYGIDTPSILCQSARIGQACLIALLDYCSIGPRPSSRLTSYGGMGRVLLEMKLSIKKSRHISSQTSPQPIGAFAAMNLVFKQY